MNESEDVDDRKLKITSSTPLRMSSRPRSHEGFCRSVVNVSMFSFVFKLLLTNYVDFFKPMAHLMLKPDFTCNIYAPRGN